MTARTNEPELVDVPERPLLMVDGRGDPKGSEFQEAVQALFSLAYGLRFALKRTLGVDRKVGPLEGLWWTEGGGFSYENRSNWRWTAMIEQADEIGPEMVAGVAASKGVTAPARLERLSEGRAAQILHVGPFADEPATIERLHAFIAQRGLRPVGRHHEIYLNDLRRAAPERLRTIIRQPVAA